LKKVRDQSIPDYELLDCGDGRRLERFSNIIADRPAPQAVWPKSGRVAGWRSVDAYYDRPDKGRAGWRDLSVFPEEWRIKVDGIALELRPSGNSQVGFFPEQLPNWRWLSERLQQAKRPVRLLNAFAYTGAATLAASASANNVEVCHLDGARAAVSWARKNAILSGLDSRPIRWIVDDVMKFLMRELERGRSYDAFIIDPPAFGRGPGATWRLERDLPLMLELAGQLLSDTPCFVILSCHAPQLTSGNLADMLEKFDAFRGCKAEALDLVIPSRKGNALPSSICGRIER